MALYFECQINKNALFQIAFFGDFAHWDTLVVYFFHCPFPIRDELMRRVIVTRINFC